MRFEVRGLRFEEVETIRGETSDGQTSDVRLTLRRETYFPLTTGSMVLGDFSTPLRCARNDRKEEI